MKSIFLIITLTMTFILRGQDADYVTAYDCQIVGGAGFIKTICSPNTINSLRVIDSRYSGSFAFDTTAQKLYVYDRHRAVGNRWKLFTTADTTTQKDFIITATRGTVHTIPANAKDVIFNFRAGLQYNTDSITLIVPTPTETKTISIFVQGAARTWIMDLILKTDTPSVSFDDGNGKPEKFAFPKQLQCIEFGLTTNNPNYDGHLFTTEQGRIWRIDLKYNVADKRWLVSKIPFN
ncbi:MAG: hypothetical protein U5L45_15895 [Saprospiraceae bacterium]|nr:hypothetical protein [Saprospiraceae bacterium]